MGRLLKRMLMIADATFATLVCVVIMIANIGYKENVKRYKEKATCGY